MLCSCWGLLSFVSLEKHARNSSATFASWLAKITEYVELLAFVANMHKILYLHWSFRRIAYAFISTESLPDEKHHCYTWTPFDGHRLLARRNQCISSPVSLASISWNSHLTVGWKSPLTSALELCLFKRPTLLPWNRRNLLYEIPIKRNTQHASRAGFNHENVRTWSLQHDNRSLSRCLLHRAGSLTAFIWAQTLSLLTLATKQRFHCPASLKKMIILPRYRSVRYKNSA